MDKFLVRLRGINSYIPVSRDKYPNAVADLRCYAAEIKKKLDEDLFKGSSILKIFARTIHNEIMANREPIIEHYIKLAVISIKKIEKRDPDFKYLQEAFEKASLLGTDTIKEIILDISRNESDRPAKDYHLLGKDPIKKILSSISKLDINKLAQEYSNYQLEDDIQYIRDIVKEIDDVLGDILEFYITYYPEELKHEEGIEHAKRFVRKDSEVLKLFLGQLGKNKDSGVVTINIKPVFKKEIIEEFYNEFKDWFDESQHKQLHKILETGEDTREKLVYIGTANELGHSLNSMLLQEIIVGVSQLELGKWMGRNFDYFSGGKLHVFSKYRISQVINKNQDTDSNLFNFSFSSDNKVMRKNKKRN